MSCHSRDGCCVIIIALVVTVLTALPAVGSAQEPVAAEPVITNAWAPPASYPFAVGGTVRKTLPPLDCWGCFGPAPCAPRAGCKRRGAEFLYYGTYPWDDDPVNGFNECPGGRCGYVATAISRGLMRPHAHRAPRDHGGRHPTCSGHCDN